MVKYICDICCKEVRTVDDLNTIKILVDNNYRYYDACNNCRKNLNEHILKIKEESKNGTT